MKILLVEDDQEISLSIASFLKEKNIVLDVAADGERGLLLAQLHHYDVILLDYNLPKINGQEIINTLRTSEDKKDVPIIIITIRSDLDDKINLLEAGADDYLVKPFSLCELLARIKAVARRPAAIKENCLTIKNLELYPDKFLVQKNKKNIRLRAKEFSLLCYLMANKGSYLSRQDIMEHVWDENADPFSNTIEVHIMKIRKKIENKRDRYIFTLSNRGYKVDEQE